MSILEKLERIISEPLVDGDAMEFLALQIIIKQISLNTWKRLKGF
jgi:hypothetical protein